MRPIDKTIFLTFTLAFTRALEPCLVHLPCLALLATSTTTSSLINNAWLIFFIINHLSLSLPLSLPTLSHFHTHTSTLQSRHDTTHRIDNGHDDITAVARAAAAATAIG
jgi:hypothetical protein